MPESIKPPVSLIGLGEMGTALAAAYISNGYPITIWNRTASKGSSLVYRGATLAVSPAACIAAAVDLVIICLVDNNAVRELLVPDTLESMRGKSIVNLTNGFQSEAEEISKLVSSHDAEYIDGGIMVPPAMIGTPSSFVLYSGSKIGLGKVEQELAILGDVKFVSGVDAGMACLLDAALLSSMYGMLAGSLQALAMAKSSGYSPSSFADELLVPFLAQLVPLLGGIAKDVEKGEYPGTGANMAMQHVANLNVMTAAREAGVWEGLLAPLASLMKRRVKGGGATEGIGSLVEELMSKKSLNRENIR